MTDDVARPRHQRRVRSSLATRVQEPESRIVVFNGALQRLRRHLRGDDAARLRLVLEQTLATQLLHGRDLLAVTGSQGAGKTTLVRELYGASVVGWLQDNPGRGEILPVLVTEDPGRTETAAQLHLLGDGTETGGLLDIEPVRDLETWHQALGGQREGAVLAELLVPPTLFAGSNRGLLLLPGYETLQRANEHFQRRMRRALAACGGFIIVTDHHRMAAAAERQILDDLHRHFANGADALVVVTRTEALPEQKRSELRTTATELFRLEEHPELVVLSGRGQAYRSEWVEALSDAVAGLGVLTPELRARQLDHLSGLVGDPLTAVLVRSRGGLAASAGTSTDSAYVEALRRFDISADRLRHKLERPLAEVIAGGTRDVAAAAASYVSESETGWKAQLQGVKAFLSLRRDSKHVRIAHHVKQRWADQLSQGLSGRLTEAIEAASAQEAHLIVPLPGAAPGGARLDVGGAGKGDLALPDHVQRTLLVLSKRRGRDSELLPDHTEDTYDLLPALTLSYLVLGMRLSEGDLGAVKAGAPLPQQNLVDSWKGLASDNKVLVYGLVGLFGLDASDGSLDTPHALATGLSTVLTGGKAAASAMLLPAVALVGAATALGLLYHAVRRSEQLDAYAERVAFLHGEAIHEQITFAIEEALAQARLVLDRRLQAYLGIDDVLAEVQRAHRAIADVERAQRRVLEVLDSARVQPV